MAALSPETVIKRFDKAWAVRELWWDLHQDIYEFILPNRNTFTRTTTPGEKKQDRVFDSTALIAAQRFVSRMQTGLTPVFERWFEMQAGVGVPLAQKAEVNKELQIATEVIHAVLNSSQFNIAASEMYHDLISGTGCMFVEEGDMKMPIHFIAIPIAQIALAEGPHNTVEEIYRKFDIKVRLIKRTWKDAKIPAGEEFEEKKDDPDKKIELVESTYWDADEDLWRYEVIHKGGFEKLVERTFEVSPWILPRWMKMPQEVFGRGPGVVALPDVKTANKVVEMNLKNAALAISAPWLVADDGVTNPDTVRIAPNALIRVARTGGTLGASIVPLETARNFDVSQLILRDMRDNIKKMMFDNQLGPVEGAVKSPTEIVARMRELRNDIGSAFGRMVAEWILPLLKRIIFILKKKGLLRLDHRAVDNINVKVQIISPLAQQQNLEDVQNVVQWMQLILSTLGTQELSAAVKTEIIAGWFAEKLGVPAKLLRSASERKEAEDKMAKAAVAQSELDNPREPPATGPPQLQAVA